MFHLSCSVNEACWWLETLAELLFFFASLHRWARGAVAGDEFRFARGLGDFPFAKTFIWEGAKTFSCSGPWTPRRRRVDLLPLLIVPGR
jgi:hypothetical protein